MANQTNRYYKDDHKQQILDWIDFEQYYRLRLSPKKVKITSKNRLQAICPFHDDNNPSLSVNLENGLWNCFGCGEKGDLFSFHKKFYNLPDFKETLNSLCAELGINMNRKKKIEPKPKSTLDPGLIQKYQHNLYNTEGSEKRLEYLRKIRGFKDETIKEYQIGWDGKDRFTIPIFDQDDVLVNFRKHKQNADSNKMISIKGHGENRLFGLDELHKRPNDPVILCAGEFDKILCSQLLPDYVVLTTTAGEGNFNEEMAQNLKDREVNVIYDVDEPGIKYAEKTVKVIAKINPRVKNVRLPLSGKKNDKDITDYFVKHNYSGNNLGNLIKKTTYFERFEDDLIAKIQEIRKDKRLMKFEKDNNIAQEIRDELKAKGEFYHDGKLPYYFDNQNKKLIEIKPESADCQLKLFEYGINDSEKIYHYVTSHLRSHILSKGKKADIFSFAHYNHSKFALYVFNFDNQVYKITPKRIQLVDNGSDGVLFLNNQNYESFKIYKKHNQKGLFRRYVIDKINISPDTLTVEEYRSIIYIWFQSIFFESIMPTKPILALIGEKGSGKSSLLMSIGLFLFGKYFSVLPLPHDQKDFEALITNLHFVAIDNADSKRHWLNDILATIGTGGSISRRDYYTTNDLVSYLVKCYLAITSRTPQFTRDDVADRLLIIPLNRFDKFVPEDQLRKEILDFRDQIWSSFIPELQGIVRKLKNNQDLKHDSFFRLSDFENFAYKTTYDDDGGEGIESIFKKMSLIQSEFTLEGDPIFETLLIWVNEREGNQQNSDREVSSGELRVELEDIANKNRIDFPYKENRSFGRRLSALKSNLKEVFEISIQPKGGNKIAYQIRMKDENDLRGVKKVN